MKILIDNGHGSNTPGKRSPDGSLREYAWTREVAKMLEAKLKALGIDAERIVPEETDISLPVRVQRVNKICAKIGAKKCLLISIHNNAAPPTDGNWHKASGWSGYVSNNASDKSKDFAQMLYAEVVKHKLQGNRSVPACKYWSANFYIIKNTNCPAVLTENLFQDNKEEVAYLLSAKGKEEIVDLHVAAIQNYIKKYD